MGDSVRSHLRSDKIKKILETAIPDYSFKELTYKGKGEELANRGVFRLREDFCLAYF